VTEPTTCPTDTAHTINLSSIAITDIVTSQLVEIKEETVPTGGHYQATTKAVTANGIETTSTDFTWSHPISVLDLCMQPQPENKGDMVSLLVSPDTMMGPISSDVSVGGTQVTLTAPQIAVLKLGYCVKLDDDTNTDDVGVITDINTSTNVVTFSTPTTNAFLAAAPTFLLMTIQVLKDFELYNTAVPINVGGAKIGGSYVPADTIVRVVYQSNSVGTKKLVTIVEYLY